MKKFEIKVKTGKPLIGVVVPLNQKGAITIEYPDGYKPLGTCTFNPDKIDFGVEDKWVKWYNYRDATNEEDNIWLPFNYITMECDFDASQKEESFFSLIRKSAIEAGYLFENPYGKEMPNMEQYNKPISVQENYGEYEFDLKQWQQAQEKLIEKLIILQQ